MLLLTRVTKSCEERQQEAFASFFLLLMAAAAFDFKLKRDKSPFSREKCAPNSNRQKDPSLSISFKK